MNHKGGVGKTTTAHALGAGLTFAGKKVLFIDLDEGGDLSYTLNIQDVGNMAGSDTSQLFKGDGVDSLAIHCSQGWDAIPSGGDLATIEPQGKHPETILKRALAEVGDNYDYCIIDTPPGLGYVVISALTAADSIVIPANATAYSLQRVGQLSRTLEAVKDHSNPALNVKGILLTEYTDRSTLSREMGKLLNDTAALLKTKVFQARIRRYQAHGEAQARQLSIFESDPNSNAAADYTAFIHEYVSE